MPAKPHQFPVPHTAASTLCHAVPQLCVSEPFPFHKAPLTGSLPAVPMGSTLEKVGKKHPFSRSFMSLLKTHCVQVPWEPTELGANRLELVSGEPAPPLEARFEATLVSP